MIIEDAKGYVITR